MENNRKLEIFSIILAVLLTILLIVITVLTVIKEIFYPLKYEDIVLENSYKFNLDPYLVFAVINTESNFNKTATSTVDAKGLMQLTSPTAKEINEITNSTEDVTDGALFNENVNIELGCKYLSDLITRYNGNYYLAICAYNAGIGNVNKWIEEGIISDNLSISNVVLPFPETSKYLQKVMKNYDTYRLLYQKLG